MFMGKKYNIQEDDFRNLIKQGLTTKEIAEYYGCSIGLIRNLRFKYNLPAKVTTPHIRKCKTCGETNPEKFQKHCKIQCRICKNKSDNKKKQTAKQKYVDYKGGKCEICGYNKYVGSLDFHHLDPSKKEFNLTCSVLNSCSHEYILKELDKCMLVCANCHRELHWKNGAKG